MKKYLKLLTLSGILLANSFPLLANVKISQSPHNLNCSATCPSGTTCIGGSCTMGMKLSLLKKNQVSTPESKLITLDTTDIFTCPNGKHVKFINNTHNFYCK